MRIYDLDTKVNRFYAYIEIHRAMREIDDRPSAKMIAEHLNGDPAQIAHALKKMAEYDGVHREEVQRRTDSTPAFAKFRYWNKKTWREAIEAEFGMDVPTEAIAKRRVVLKTPNNISVLPVKQEPVESVLSVEQIRSMSDKQIAMTLYSLSKEVASRTSERNLKKAS